jgi:hypothetical protein
MIVRFFSVGNLRSAVRHSDPLDELPSPVLCMVVASLTLSMTWQILQLFDNLPLVVTLSCIAIPHQSVSMTTAHHQSYRLDRVWEARTFPSPHVSWNILLQPWNRVRCRGQRRPSLGQRKEPMTNSV